MANDWKSQWESMTVDELFALREEMQEVLSIKLRAQKAELERRLQILNQQSNDDGPAKSRPP
jgi:BMFP domain-containing protein YqiC